MAPRAAALDRKSSLAFEHPPSGTLLPRKAAQQAGVNRGENYTFIEEVSE